MFARLAVTLLLALPGPETTPAPRLSGGFIQLQGWMMKLTPDEWHRELDAMHAVGLDTIIIQYLEYGRQSFIPSEASVTDGIVPDVAFGSRFVLDTW